MNNYDEEKRWMQFSADLSKRELTDAIKVQYKENQKALKQASSKMSRDTAINMQYINEIIYDSSRDIQKNPDIKDSLEESLQRIRFAGLKILGEEIRFAAAVINQKIKAPARSILIKLHNLDAREYQKEYDKLYKMYSKIREKIDISAKKRLNRINRFYFKRNRQQFSEQNLPYSSRERRIIEKYHKELNKIKTNKNISEEKSSFIERQIQREKELIAKTRENIDILKYPNLSRQTQEQDKIKSNSELQSESIQENDEYLKAAKENYRERKSQIKELEAETDKETIKALKKMFLTNGQYHSALSANKMFPDIGIADIPIIKDMDPDKIILCSYIYDKAEREHNGAELFSDLNKLNTVQLHDIGYKLDREEIEISNIPDIVIEYIEERKNPNKGKEIVDIIYSEDGHSAAIVKGDGFSTDSAIIVSYDNEQITDVHEDNPDILFEALENDLKVAQERAAQSNVERSLDALEKNLAKDESFEFGIEENAYKASIDNGRLSVEKYDFETNSYKKISYENMIKEFVKNPKSLTEVVYPKIHREETTVQKETETYFTERSRM